MLDRDNSHTGQSARGSPDVPVGARHHIHDLYKSQHLLCAKLASKEMEFAEGMLSLVEFFMGNPEFVLGLRSLARRHFSAFKNYLREIITRAPDFTDRLSQYHQEEGLDVAYFGPKLFMMTTELSRELLTMQAYRQELTQYCREWNLAFFDPKREQLAIDLFHTKLMVELGFQWWGENSPLEPIIVVMDGPLTKVVRFSIFDVARLGTDGISRTIASRLWKETFYRVRKRRAESLQWLYLRLGQRIPPGQIADLYNESEEKTVARHIKRDANLLGLKLPVG